MFDLGVLHHIVERLQALHHSEDAKHCLHAEEMKWEADVKKNTDLCQAASFFNIYK